MQCSNPSTEGPKLQVRRLEISDKSSFIELLQQLTVCDSVSDKEFEDRFQELSILGDDHVICVIEDDRSGKIIATGSVFIEKKFIRNCGKVGHIEDVVVDSNARGMQLGKKIIGFLTDHARSMGCYKISMASSLLQWESDPLFSAAEVVQDSADRMESIFRLLVHELTLVQGDQTDPKLLASINYHRRDLATTLETAKWQLEDFERAVSLSAVTDKSKMREDVISRNRQFIRAIREQIIQVEKSLEEASIGYPIKNADWINLNEEDRDGLALFLSGGSPSKSSSPYELEDSGILRRFLDPTTASSSQDNTSHNFEIKSIKVDNLNKNEVVHVNHNFGSMGNNLRNMDSCFSSQLGESRDNLLETYCNGYGEDGNWDLEVNQTKPQNGFHENKLRRFRSRNNIFGFFGNLWTAYESPFTRNYIKRLKDGEEQAHSTTGTDVLNDAQSWLGTCRVRYQRWTHYVQVNRHSFRLILSIIFTLIILGMLVSRMA